MIYLEHKLLYNIRGEVPRSRMKSPGVADVKQEGTDLTLVATGGMVPLSLAAAGTLAGEGISWKLSTLGH